MPTRRHARCHPDRPHYALGVCRACHGQGLGEGWPRATCEHKGRPSKSRTITVCSSCHTLATIASNPPATCHPDRPMRYVTGKLAGWCVGCGNRAKKYGAAPALEGDCAICGVTFRRLQPGERGSSFEGAEGVTDHCHECGNIRGLLRYLFGHHC